jgi:hypothetical protein
LLVLDLPAYLPEKFEKRTIAVVKVNNKYFDILNLEEFTGRGEFVSGCRIKDLTPEELPEISKKTLKVW